MGCQCQVIAFNSTPLRSVGSTTLLSLVPKQYRTLNPVPLLTIAPLVAEVFLMVTRIRMTGADQPLLDMPKNVGRLDEVQRLASWSTRISEPHVPNLVPKDSRHGVQDSSYGGRISVFA